MIVMKIGGSVITDKKRLKALRLHALNAIAESISKCEEEIIIIHGAGSFGHILADKYRVTSGSALPSQISEIHRDVRELNLAVMNALISKGVHSISIPPWDVVVMSMGSISSFSPRPFKHAIERGLTPVTFGDVVPDTIRVFSICSGDDLALMLAKEFAPNIVVFLSDVDGVLSANGSVLRRVRVGELEEIASVADGRADVTGGMKRKVEIMGKICGLGIPCAVVNGLASDRVERALRGDIEGTLILP
ncbi:MAG: hypothetical protein DRN20_03260 [Thermoplasmata archaeon]|nr:MAG: hypothetical protein DRN20_03260 [Thermoplasmata archaeon]